MKRHAAELITRDPERFFHHDRVFLNNPVVMQGMGLAPLVVLATSGQNALMLAVAVALLLTPSRMLACLLSRLFPLREEHPELCYFDPNFTGEYPEEAPFTISELEKIYPEASARSKVDAEFAAQKKNYEEFPEVRAYIDEYCKSVGITLDGYYAAIQDQLPRVILRQKLRNELGREYCAEHGLEFTKVNPPEDMQRYVENYLEGLLDTYRADITYCK